MDANQKWDQSHPSWTFGYLYGDTPGVGDTAFTNDQDVFRWMLSDGLNDTGNAFGRGMPMPKGNTPDEEGMILNRLMEFLQQQMQRTGRTIKMYLYCETEYTCRPQGV